MKLIKSIALLGILIIGLSGSVQAATYTLDITFYDDYINLTPESKINSLDFAITSPYTVERDPTIIPTVWDTRTYLTGDPGVQGVLNDGATPNPLGPIGVGGRIFAITSDSAPTALSFSDFRFNQFQSLNNDGTYDIAWGLVDDPNNPDPNAPLIPGTIRGLYFTSSFQVVPIPAAVWLLGSGIVGLVALKHRKKS